MAGFLHKLFGRRSKLFELASGSDSTAFASAIGAADVILIAEPTSKGPDLDSLTEEELLAEIQRGAEEMAEREGFDPFVYEDEGDHFLPFFTSAKAADQFIGAYSSRENRLIGFQTFGIKGASLAIAANWDATLIMDPQSDDEVVLSKDHVNALCARWG